MNTPKIRFKGFEDDWEQRKLSDCAEFRRGSFPQPYGNKDWYDGKGAMPFVQVADVSSDMKLVNDTKQKISKLAQPMSVFAEKGSVLVTLQGSIGRVAITQYGAFVDRTVLIFDKYKDDIDKKFWAYIIKEKFEYEAKKAPGGTIKTITKEVLANFDLMLPCYAEQSILADYLIKLDHLITLHQCKCDETKELKKFMLQKMFPKNGEKNPEIRFEGFTDDWEQRKLGDIVDVRSGKDYKHLSEGNIPVYGTGGYMLSVNQALSYDEDAIGIGRKGTIDKPYILKAPFWTVDTLFYAVPSQNSDLDFVFDIFQNIDWKKKDESTGVPSLSKTAINEIDISAPCLEEQQVIGSYFSKIDHLIALHQRKCEKLKELKKFMLQNMFV
ncbi:restriction endonuclease subunit S [Clostridium sp. AF15-6B]|nr:restriction endonuclease subunit S [Clostridium sp. AF16-25]RGH03123.1 restriction endonuclease subunit S [Clostridium sp. AF15-49]RGH06337.1 restriction endonuclease subunit S [Clostridium sp. AF15-6B]